ncbi:MAG: SLBB domain-containing protein [Cyanobacteria bacterium J06621_11]
MKIRAFTLLRRLWLLPVAFVAIAVAGLPVSAQRMSSQRASSHGVDPVSAGTDSVEEPAQLTVLAETPYTLGAGDVLSIDIFRVPQYSGESQVLVDGTMNLPLVGNIDLDGLTIDQASEVMAERYGEYLRRPLLTVSLVRSRPLQIGIAGEINRPGSYALNRDGLALPRLTQLLERAGGTTQAADIRQVQIQRRLNNGNYEELQVDLWRLLQTGDQAQDVTLRDGDSIFVPTTAVPLSETELLADASFAGSVSQPINIAIVGEVYRPGPYTLQGGQARTGDAGVPGSSAGSNSPTTVTRALQVAGGIKPEADIRRVQVVRPTRSGTSQVFEVDLWQLLEIGNLEQDAILAAGDTVFVPTATAIDPEAVPEIAAASFSPNAIQVNVVGETERTGRLELPPNTSLSQAILAAGGFNNRANEGEAELIRLNPNGSVSRRTISVDFAQAIDEELNPLLRNDDVVVVNPSAIANIDDTVGSFLGPLGRVVQNVFFPLRLFGLFD